MYIYYKTAAGNSISSQLGSSSQGNRYSMEKAGGTALPSSTISHLPGHSSPASQAGRRVGPASSLRPHCLHVWRKEGRCCFMTLHCSLYHVIRAHVLSPPFYDGVRFFTLSLFSYPFLVLTADSSVFYSFFTSCDSFTLLSSILLPGF